MWLALAAQKEPQAAADQKGLGNVGGGQKGCRLKGALRAHARITFDKFYSSGNLVAKY